MSEQIGQPDPDLEKEERRTRELGNTVWESGYMDALIENLPEGSYYDEESGCFVVPDIGNLDIQTC